MGACIASGTNIDDFRNSLALFVALLISPPIAANLRFGPAGKRGNSFRSHAVKTSTGAVGIFVELGAGAYRGHDHFERGSACCRMHVHRNAAAIVTHHHTAIDVDLNMNDLAVASQCFIHRVVDKLINEMMQTTGVDIADIHTGAAANVVSIAQDLHIFATVSTHVFWYWNGRVSLTHCSSPLESPGPRVVPIFPGRKRKAVIFAPLSRSLRAASKASL